MHKIVIDSEIAVQCPALTPDERAGLEASILAEGCRDPLIVWDTSEGQILLDGHNRLEICQRFGKEYAVKPMQFEDRFAAMIWVLHNQRSRRNLTDDQRAMLADRERELLSKQARQRRSEEAARARWEAPCLSNNVIDKHDTRAEVAERAGVSERKVQQAKFVSEQRPDLAQQVLSGGMPLASAVREIKRETIKTHLEDVDVREAKVTHGVYDVIVIDPPWPIEKIERDERPNQSEFEYPTMAIGDIARLNIPCADNCHVWLWTTHRFLPDALHLLNVWNLKYVCTFVWHKPGGFQPFDLPQYNCEFALYARRGTPKFIDTKAFPVCFNAPRAEHSVKPEAFYEMIRRVTAGRRLDMFNRRAIDGFDGWGKETESGI